MSSEQAENKSLTQSSEEVTSEEEKKQETVPAETQEEVNKSSESASSSEDESSKESSSSASSSGSGSEEQEEEEKKEEEEEKEEAVEEEENKNEPNVKEEVEEVKKEEPTPSPRPVDVEEKAETPIEEQEHAEEAKDDEHTSSSSTPDVPPVEIAQPSSTSPNDDDDIKRPQPRRAGEKVPPRAVSKPISPFINDDMEYSDFDGKLTETQQKRLVDPKGTLAELYEKAKKYEHMAYTTLGEKKKEKTWPEFMEDVKKYGCGFVKKPQQNILISMANCDSAYSIGFAAMLTGKHVIYVNPTLPMYRFDVLLNMANVELAFIDNTILDDFRDLQKTHEDLQIVVVGTDVGKDKNLCSLGVFFGEVAEESEFENAMKELKPETVAEIIPIVHGQGYKGVIWTHGNIMAALSANDPGLDENMSVMEVLPQAAIGERIYGLYEALNFHLHVFIAHYTDLQFGGSKFMKMLKSCKPKFMLGTPRIYEKIAHYAESKIDNSSLLTRKMKGFAAKKGVDGAAKQGLGESKPKGYGLSRTLVYNKALKSLGLHKCFCACWGVMPDKSRDKCLGLGISVFEGLMLPETTGFCLLQRRNLYVPGTYGCKVSGVDISMRDDEIIVNGPTVSPGYTNEGAMHVYPFDNGFKTYLLAKPSKYGKEKESFYKPKGYKHPMIITTNAEMIEPHYIEKTLATIPTIDKCMLIGEGEKFLAALFQMNYEEAKTELKEKCPPKEQIRSDAYYGTYLRQKVENFNQTLPRAYRIKKFVIVDLSETVVPSEGNTPMDKRQQVVKRYEKGIDKLYHPPEVDETEEQKRKLKEDAEIQRQRRKEEKMREKGKQPQSTTAAPKKSNETTTQKKSTGNKPSTSSQGQKSKPSGSAPSPKKGHHHHHHHSKDGERHHHHHHHHHHHTEKKEETK